LDEKEDAMAEKKSEGGHTFSWSRIIPQFIPQFIVAIVAILLMAVGVLIQPHLQVAQFLAIVAACAAIIFILLGLPNLHAKLEEHIHASQEQGERISALQDRMAELCSEITEGTPARMSWIVFWRHVRDLQKVIESDTAFVPQVVLSVGRSGAIVGGLLAGNMGGITHIGIDRDHEWLRHRGVLKRVTKIIPSVRTISSLLESKNVLCVMSECDSGRTLEALLTELTEVEGIGEIRTAVLFRNSSTFFAPDYIAVQDRGHRPEFPFRTTDWLRSSKQPSRENSG
jgi:hypoxanthine phosphoribosyltransferase